MTEFLPISSTAHLRIVPALLGWDDPGAAFTAVLQLGTLAAVIGFFLRDLARMLRAALAALGDPVAAATDPDARDAALPDRRARSRSASRGILLRHASRERSARSG